MNEQVTIDSSGRVQLPKAICDRLGFVPGTILEVEASNDNGVHLRPAKEEKTFVVEKEGVLVIQAIAVEDLKAIGKREREARLAQLIQSIK
jgi:AbrB family looped-hinge helix DNA binding protein